MNVKKRMVLSYHTYMGEGYHIHYDFFKEIYKNIDIPVIVCEDCDEMPIIFANTEAYLLLNPQLIVGNIGASERTGMPLGHLIRFKDAIDHQDFHRALHNTGSVRRHFITLLSSEGTLIPTTVTANTVCHCNNKYIVIYIFSGETNNRDDDVLDSVLNISYHATDVDSAVNTIIARIGEYIGVSRVYIFEDLFNNYTRNTYEWCDLGIEPAIQDLQNLCKDDYNYDAIIGAGMYITDDVSALPEEDRAILEPQGIKALAILPLFYQDMPIGYIGYDDCNNARTWGYKDLLLLKGAGSVISSLIIRRNYEAKILRSHEVLQTISNNIDSAIYVNDVNSYELKFVNKALASKFGKTPEELLGQKCWQTLQAGMDGPCPFCPIPKLFTQDKVKSGATIEWEHQNTITEEWFWLKDSIIQWVDGTLAHLEVAIDITMRKRSEEKLQQYASTDSLTGVFNREWGVSIVQKEYQAARSSKAPLSLCFIDIDGLKDANDSHGHRIGDMVILGISEALCGHTRKNHDMVCRWGGDEFLVLLKCGVDRAEIIMKNVTSDLDDVNSKNSENPALSFSYGIVNLTSSDSVDSAIALADQLMYENKKSKQRRINNNE